MTRHDQTPRPRRTRRIDPITAVTVPVLLCAYIAQPDVASLTVAWRLGLLTAALAALVIFEHVAESERKDLRLLMVIVAVGIVGIAFAGGLREQYQNTLTNNKRCLAIQRDMLSSLPLRSDDPELFQALGCRPQGGGSVYATRDIGDQSTLASKAEKRAALPYREP